MPALVGGTREYQTLLSVLEKAVDGLPDGVLTFEERLAVMDTEMRLRQILDGLCTPVPGYPSPADLAWAHRTLATDGDRDSSAAVESWFATVRVTVDWRAASPDFLVAGLGALRGVRAVELIGPYAVQSASTTIVPVDVVEADVVEADVVDADGEAPSVS